MVVGSNWGRYFYQKWCFLQSFDLKELEKTSTIKVIGSGVQVLPPTYQSRVQSIYCADDSHSVRNYYFINKSCVHLKTLTLKNVGTCVFHYIVRVLIFTKFYAVKNTSSEIFLCPKLFPCFFETWHIRKIM